MACGYPEGALGSHRPLGVHTQWMQPLLSVCEINSQLILRSVYTAQENPVSHGSRSDGPGLPLLHAGSTPSDISCIICHPVLLWSLIHLPHLRARKFFLLCIPNLLAI